MPYAPGLRPELSQNTPISSPLEIDGLLVPITFLTLGFRYKGKLETGVNYLPPLVKSGREWCRFKTLRC